jgi:hypothetical protein
MSTEDSGQLADVTEQLAVGNVLGLVGFISFIDNGDLQRWRINTAETKRQ